MNTVKLADAKAHLSELVSQVEAGDAINITRRGTPVAQLTAIKAARRKIEASSLREMTDAMPRQNTPAAVFTRGMRDDDRY
ncbi:MAG: type II toxin-antitoxin system prevent-host-death family antitoxin [Rhodospirillaceae bacterium]|jgi:prevent-host-death family protein|nr:type II toxin-antitoxin system prevent-host-death family antitoxin [Rhodospirillaceae bacterium]